MTEGRRACMNVSNNTQSLQQVFAMREAEQTSASEKSPTPATAGVDDLATLSPAASIAAQSADSDVRTDKVAEVQQALATGSYSIPASRVADSMIDRMLGR